MNKFTSFFRVTVLQVSHMKEKVKSFCNKNLYQVKNAVPDFKSQPAEERITTPISVSRQYGKQPTE
jgi:hypothetical protein